MQEIIHNLIHSLNAFLNRHIHISTSDLCWYSLAIYSPFFVKSFLIGLKKKSSTIDLMAIIFGRLGVVISILIYNNAFNLKIYNERVFLALIVYAMISSIFFKKKIHLLQLIPIFILIFNYPYFHGKVLLTIVVCLYYLWFLFIFSVSRIRFSRLQKYYTALKLNPEPGRKEISFFRLEKIFQGSQTQFSSLYKHNFLIGAIDIMIPGNWLAYGIFFTHLGEWFMDSTVGKDEYISTINKNTYLASIHTVSNSLFICLTAVFLFFGINFETILFSGLVAGFNFYLTWNVINLAGNITILNANGGSFSSILFKRLSQFLLLRTKPENKSSISSLQYRTLFGDRSSYGILHNFSPVYLTDKVEEYTDIRKNCRHFILIFSNENTDVIHLLEEDMRYGLSSLTTVMDCWETPQETEPDKYSVTIPAEEAGLARKRIRLYAKLSDEDIENFDKDNVSKEIKHMDERISTEAIRTNISLREKYSQEEHEMLDVLQSAGLFEFNCLFRQLHETPSIPLRFIECLVIYEAAAQYLCGFLFARPLHSPPSASILDNPEGIRS